MPYERVTSDIHISPELKNVLEEIKDNSSVANELCKARIHKDLLVDDHVNYISISKNDTTKISYMSQDRLEKCLENGMDPWTSKGRYKCKFGGFVNKIFKNVPGPEIENFATLMKSVMTKKELNFKVVDGEDIRYFYHVDQHAKEDGVGTLGVSCMRHPRCQQTCDIYTDNPSMIKMLVLLDDYGKVLGRALLWNIECEDGNFTFMDRVYTHDDRDVFHFKDWANKNGFAYKYKQSWNTPYIFQSKGSVFKKKMSIEIPNWEYKLQDDMGGYPYFDTFKWMDIDNGKFFNYLPTIEEYPNRNRLRTMISTCGEYNGTDQLDIDEIHDEYWYREEISYVDYLKKKVNRRYLVYSNIHDAQLMQEDSKWDEDIQDYIYNEKYDHLNNYEAIEERKKSLKEAKENEAKRMEKLRAKMSQDDIDGLIRQEVEGRVRNYYTYYDESEPSIEDIDENESTEIREEDSESENTQSSYRQSIRRSRRRTEATDSIIRYLNYVVNDINNNSTSNE